MNTVENVSASKPAVGGAVWRAPLGTKLPDNAADKLDEAFVSLGYISDEGLKHNINRSTSDTKAWGGDLVMTSETDKSDEYKFTCIEALNPEVLKMVNGNSNVEGTLADGMTVKSNSKELDEAAYVIERILRGNVIARTVIERAKVGNIDEITESDNTPIGYSVTLKPYPDANGDTSKTFYKKGSGASTLSEEPGDEPVAVEEDTTWQE